MPNRRATHNKHVPTQHALHIWKQTPIQLHGAYTYMCRHTGSPCSMHVAQTHLLQQNTVSLTHQYD